MIINSQQRVRVSAPELQRFLGEVQEILRIPEGAVTVCLVPGARIARWNRMYRGKAKATDVLSFPVDDNSKALRGGNGSFLTHPHERRVGYPQTYKKQNRIQKQGDSSRSAQTADRFGMTRSGIEEIDAWSYAETAKAKATSRRGGNGSFLTHPVRLPARRSARKRRVGYPQRHQRQNLPADTSKARAEANYLGDIAICPAVAQRNARSSNRPLSAELRILILHGILHLLGYDHETDTGQMERRERKLRRRLGLK